VFPSCPWNRSRNFRVFATYGFRFNPKAVTGSLSSFTLFFRVHQRSSCLLLASVSRDKSLAPPVEFSPLPCFPTWGSGCFQVSASMAKTLAPPGSLNLMTLSSAPCLPALFHAGSTLGVLPPKALLLSCSRSPSPTPLPSCRYDALLSAPSLTDLPISRCPASPVCSSLSAPRLQGFAPH